MLLSPPNQTLKTLDKLSSDTVQFSSLPGNSSLMTARNEILSKIPVTPRGYDDTSIAPIFHSLQPFLAYSPGLLFAEKRSRDNLPGETLSRAHARGNWIIVKVRQRSPSEKESKRVRRGAGRIRRRKSPGGGVASKGNFTKADPLRNECYITLLMLYAS